MLVNLFYLRLKECSLALVLVLLDSKFSLSPGLRECTGRTSFHLSILSLAC